MALAIPLTLPFSPAVTFIPERRNKPTAILPAPAPIQAVTARRLSGMT
ncbi:MAG: hypothetical protein WCF84_20030 [Anaerolineae bacterium]